MHGNGRWIVGVAGEALSAVVTGVKAAWSARARPIPPAADREQQALEGYRAEKLPANNRRRSPTKNFTIESAE